MPKLLAFDVGSARLGVARLTALGNGEPLTIIKAKRMPWRMQVAQIKELVNQYEIEGFVVGLARNMDGSIGPQARQCKQFARALGNAFPDFPIFLEDERLSTDEAYERLAELGMRGQKAREVVDSMAAAVIVESYMARLEMERAAEERERDREND